MTHFLERTALVLLAGTALSVSTGSWGATAQPLLDVPPATAESAVAAPGVDAFARARSSSSTYTVRRGDTLAEIADRLNVSVEALAKANGLKRPYRLLPGKVLKNPAAKATATAPAKGSTGKARGESETYVVRAGDTLFGIAQRFGVSVADLKAANGMGRSSSIARGRKLTIPGAGGSDEVEAVAPPSRAGRASRDEEPSAPEDFGSDRSAAGRVVTIQTAGKAYRVKRGDTLEGVARRMDSSVTELARINKLKRPYRLRAGQTIRGPGGSAKAYVVARGDTLGEIAQRFSVSVDSLRTANGLRRGASLAPGRRLRLPAGYRDRGPIREEAPAPAPRPSRPTFDNPPPQPQPQPQPPPRSSQPEAGAALPSAPQPYVPSRTQRPPRSTYTPPSGPISGAPTASPQVSDAQIMQMGRGVFQWPIRGEVISGFGDKGTSQRNDGLNIRARGGEAVRASASGDVVYAGDQVPGFGNLVLIKHDNGWVTAYGHLGRVDVRMQQKVTQGQQIGEAGSTGGVSEPQLHFEVRYAPTPQERARPIDPALVLPR
ncbi:LysM peptidoglycan-binding domain-containing protein [uncultured Phenylobacterium sp.]|uniref:LysM peptidoglycan-binding domain-containing protein n=1 Tax=uncultured Phenylobacterium sp. TaxID=349273 RepID=UPI0025F09DD3|nr:LysM peptidoglycan-binding domain-containing protein [uncultured Phenylobacterium sp.]